MDVIKFVADNNMYFVLGILIFFGLMEVIFGYYANSKRNKDDVMIELINTFFLMVITKPLLMFLSFSFLQWLIPHQEGALSFLPFWLNLLIFILLDDVSQYGYHRFAHENKWFWKWHRSHHTATEMGLLVSYRQNIYFYMLMPNVWLLGVYTYFGGGIAVAVAIVLKQIVVIASHSMVHWDAFFYKNKALTPIIKVLERIIVTPAFHHAHHAVSRIDGIGNPEGNFGNMFTIWDQLFGTAKFPHAFSKEYGIPNDTHDSWAAHSFYPFIKSDKAGSDISKDFTFEKTTVNEPAVLTLKEGDYLYCQCGYSKHQPFCDGSHHGTKSHPMKFTIKKEREYKLCLCKTCAKGPFCDDSHLKLG